MFESEQRSCEEFNSGRYNSIAMAYLILALRQAEENAGLKRQDAQNVLLAFHQGLDGLTAEEALNLYRA